MEAPGAGSQENHYAQHVQRASERGRGAIFDLRFRVWRVE